MLAVVMGEYDDIILTGHGCLTDFEASICKSILKTVITIIHITCASENSTVQKLGRISDDWKRNGIYLMTFRDQNF